MKINRVRYIIRDDIPVPEIQERTDDLTESIIKLNVGESVNCRIESLSEEFVANMRSHELKNNVEFFVEGNQLRIWRIK